MSEAFQYDDGCRLLIFRHADEECQALTAHYSGIRFNLWATKEPKFDASGHIDIKGFKVFRIPLSPLSMKTGTDKP